MVNLKDRHWKGSCNVNRLSWSQRQAEGSVFLLLPKKGCFFRGARSNAALDKVSSTNKRAKVLKSCFNTYGPVEALMSLALFQPKPLRGVGGEGAVSSLQGKLKLWTVLNFYFLHIFLYFPADILVKACVSTRTRNTT